MDRYDTNATPTRVGETETMTNVQQTTDDAEEPATDHLDDVDDGCGCAEVWEHLSENREEAADD